MNQATPTKQAQEGPLAVIERPVVTYNGEPLLARARALQYDTDLDLETANQVKKQCKEAVKTIEKGFERSTKAAHEAHKRVVELRDGMTKPFAVAADWIQKKIDAALLRRREEAAKLQAEREAAAKKEAEERQLAETIRLEEEAKAKRAEAERLAAEGKTSEAEIAAAEAEQNEQAAKETIEAAPEVIPVPEVVPAAIPGMVEADNWIAEVTDETAFYKALGERPELWRYAPIDLKELNRTAKKDKDSRTIPGVTIKNVPKARTR